MEYSQFGNTVGSLAQTAHERACSPTAYRIYHSTAATLTALALVGGYMHEHGRESGTVSAAQSNEEVYETYSPPSLEESATPEIALSRESVEMILATMPEQSEQISDAQLELMQEMTSQIKDNYQEWYTNNQIESLVKLWWRESRWLPTTVNSESGARGIPQRHPKYHGMTQAYIADPATQIAWGLRYIEQRKEYGSPQKAWEHSEQHGWY